MSSSEVNGDADGVYEKVQEYYGKTLTSTKDLATDACCVLDEESKQIRKLLKNVHPEVTDRFYGCGSPVPPLLEGKTVLDLGCGTGRDCFLASQLGTLRRRVYMAAYVIASGYESYQWEKRAKLSELT
eukprot:gb/GECG01003511.1/.p1 GENE.gb/GECG01003511.1/~~gb/GECG01003511.1/.p1  ORF type:complete len:128 (+),score=20.79 gb/GECG01003511.1/:1-384(+)